MPENEPTATARTIRDGGGSFLAKQSGQKKKRRFWLNLATVAITLILVLGVVTWLTAFHFYNVSSNSMAPALLSSLDHNDRLLCSKLTYHLRKPVRWEVATFDTPSTSANTTIAGFQTGGETGLTVKRIVGLENEHLAIAGGDIWTRPLAGGEFVRQVKPDSVQRGMWIEVYTEDCSNISDDEFFLFWKKLGGEKAGLTPDRILRLGDGTSIGYIPKTRVGVTGSNMRMLELPGIPDRYLLPQQLFFKCQSCGADYDIHWEKQIIYSRCPVCRHLNDESAVTYYELRSGLPETGEYHAGNVPQGDLAHFRNNTYNFVSDLKITAEIRLVGPGSRFRAELSGDKRVASIELGADNPLVNDRALSGGKAALRPGTWTMVEFQVVDGVVRLFIGPDRTEVFNRVMWKGENHGDRYDGGESGILLAAKGGDIELRRLSIHRDIHYFSGRRDGMGAYLGAMDVNGEIDLPPGTFLPLGDNTTVSLDGRSWGAVNMSLLRGAALYIWSPKERAGRIPSP